MRQAILQAAASGDIEAASLAHRYERAPPGFRQGRMPDPIAYLKVASADGNGREILAILYSLLTTGYAIENAGTKDEMIVWPYHAAVPLDRLSPSQEVEIYRFLPPARLKEMVAAGKYRFYSIGIAATAFGITSRRIEGRISAALLRFARHSPPSRAFSLIGGRSPVSTTYYGEAAMIVKPSASLSAPRRPEDTLFKP